MAKRLFIDTDESIKLDIWARRFRTFDLDITVPTPPVGTIRMAVVDVSGTKYLELSTGSGITIQGSVIKLKIVASGMLLPSGVYSYDITETLDEDVFSRFTGTFTVVPSYTPIATA